MGKRQVPQRAMVDQARERAAIGAASVGAAILAVGIALVAMVGSFALAAAFGVVSAPGTLTDAIRNAAGALYVSQLVGVSFFGGTAELRFAAVPGLLLVGASVLATAGAAARLMPGSARRKMAVALAMPIPYALLLGLGAIFLPLRLSMPGIGGEVAVSPSATEAFALPFLWGLLFAFVGGILGAFGKGWRPAVAQSLGAWEIPVRSSLRVLAVGLLASLALAMAAGLTVFAGDLGSVTGRPGSVLGAAGAAVLVLPTLAVALLVSSFGVSFEWQVDALSHQSGSFSAFGGALPFGDPSHPAGVPGLLLVMPLFGLAVAGAAGWLAARRSGSNRGLCISATVRSAMLLTVAVWLLALLARMDAQAGGLLGLHLAPDGAALLWRVPLVAFAGCFAGSLACVLTRGAASRRALAATLAVALRPSHWDRGVGRAPEAGRAGRGLTWRAALGLSFAALPATLVGMGATGAAAPPQPKQVSVAPIERAAEKELKRASTRDGAVEATVDPETRAVSSASVHTPLRKLGIPRGEPRAAKAKRVLQEYGDLFGLADPSTELGNAKVSTDRFGVTHVGFTQMADGLPVFGGGIGVHLSHKGELLSFVSGSVIPEISVSQGAAKLSRRDAIEVAKKALPAGELATRPTLQVYAGLPPYISGSHARLAWMVWMISEKDHESNEYVVDAVTGEILDTVTKADRALERFVYDAEEEANIPGKLVREEGDPATEDADADHAYEYTGDVYDYYKEWVERDSFDNEGAPLISTVHYAQASGAPFKNAYWNGQQMVFGNGFSVALDIVGHELTHAYVQYTSGLVNTGQSGALNESFADIMGAAIEMQYTEKVDWRIGEDLPGGIGPIRSLSNPGELEGLKTTEEEVPYPAKLSEWVETCLDQFGVHINSTITSHAFYRAVINLSEELEAEVLEVVPIVVQIFSAGFTDFLTGNNTASLEDARAATREAAASYYGEESEVFKAVDDAFDEVGLNGEAQPAAASHCSFECSFEAALSQQEVNSADASEMLITLYKARGELAQGTPAGEHFMPLYEGHMVRISELVSEDPTLAEMTVEGLAELTPALEALVEGEGDQFKLSASDMKRIEAALRRLAQDDRLYDGEGAGELADLIENELEWMGLPSYAGMDYQAGFARLNEEVSSQSLLEETGVIIDPNCSGQPYSNDFNVNGLYVDTPGHHIPGQVSPLVTGGIICGAEVEVGSGYSGCPGEESLNTEVTVDLPPGEDVRPTGELPSKSWVGEAVGYVIACAGDKTRRIYGQAGLLSLSSWSSSQCPESAIACYEGRTTYEERVGRGYAWVSEDEEGNLSLTTRPINVIVEGIYEAQVSFGQFEVDLCGRAGESAEEECGGASAPWVHRNGDASEAGCAGGDGRYEAQAENAAGETTIPVSSCVSWPSGAQMLPVGAPDSLEDISCVSGTTSCVAADSEGDAYYATDVSSGSPVTWHSWSGPEASPSRAVECPSTELCLLAAGEVEGGGNVYRSSSLGGSFLTSFKPSYGVRAISCPSTSFCVTAQGGGYIRYSTKPSGILWHAVTVGTGAMEDVSCLSASFCAVVDDSGNVRVATTEARVKETSGWTATNVNGEAALRAVACTSTTSCLAVGGSDEVIDLTIELPSGEATAEAQTIDGAGELGDITCRGETCVAVDKQGGVFTSADSGTNWSKRLATAGDATGVSCASESLCASVDTSGDVAMFDPE